MSVGFAPTAEDVLGFLPLFPEETEEAILARMESWANEGLDPVVDVDQWVDTREGSHWRTQAVPVARELARLYDLAGTEVVMAGMILWTWGTYLDDQAAVYDIERLVATYATGIVEFTSTRLTSYDADAGTQVGVAPAQPDDDAPLFQTTAAATIPAGGTVDVPVRAVESGKSGDVGADTITAPSTPLPSGITFTNPDPTSGGTNPEQDDPLRTRLMATFVGVSGGNVRWYEREARAEPGVGRVTVIALWDGPGTVLVIVTDPDGQPVSADVVDALQAKLDPVPEHGAGDAQVGAKVTVVTATAMAVAIAATVTFEAGYSLDPTAGGTALRPLIEAVLRDYIATVPPGGELVHTQVEGRIATVPGVHDVSGVTINGSAANVAVPGGATPEVPFLNDASGIVAA